MGYFYAESEVLFSDGSPLTAKDVLFRINYLKKKVFLL